MLLHDLSFAVRTLRRSPVFTLAAVLTIALGIGASTAIFSVTNAVLLRPLPYTDPDRLVVMYMDLRARHTLGMPLSNENYADIRNGSTGVFEDMAAVRTLRQVLPGADGTPEEIRLGAGDDELFQADGRAGRGRPRLPGLRRPAAAAGRGSAAPDVQAPPAAVAILSHAYWLRRYGGDAKVLGQRIPGGPRPEIIGVLAPGLELMFPSGANVEERPDCWVANRLSYDNANRNTFGLRPIGRFKPGVTLARAQEQVESVAAKLRQDIPLQTTAGFYARLEPMHDTLVEEVRPAILALTGAVTFLFLIACANVANLLLVRAWAREGELAVRAALGAGRWRIVRQMLADAFVLTGLGAFAGVALAWIGTRELRTIAPANLPRLDAIGIDSTVLGFSAAIALAVAVLFGMVPAWSAFRMDPMTVLRGSSRTAGLSAGRTFRNGVVVAEVALCFVLLIGSGLMFRTFLELQRIDPGFDPRGLLTFQLLGGRPGPPAQRAELAKQIEERLRAIPGVERVTASFPFPLAGGFSTIRWGTGEALADNSQYQAVDWQIVRPGYFDTLRTRLLAGRPFTEADSDPRRNLVVVDQMLAAKAFPNESAVGKRILIRIRTPEPEWVEIIGVVAHQRVASLADPGREQVYFADGFTGGNANKWAMRVSGDPGSYGSAVRAAIAQVDPQFLITELQPMDDLVRRAQAGTRFTLILIATFATVAALLVGVGLYGVLATVVRQRTAIAAGIARDAHRPLVRVATGESIGKVDLFTAGIGERGDALVCDDADDLDPFGLGCADAYQNAFADRGFVRERLRRQHLIHDHQISSGIAIGLGERPARQQARAQRVEIPRSNNLPVDRLVLRVVGERLPGTQRMVLKPPASGNGNDAVTRSTPGIARSRSSICLASSARCAGTGRPPRSWNVSRPRGSNSGSMRCSSRKVRNINPDPMSSTKHSATSATTTPCLNFRPALRPAMQAAAAKDGHGVHAEGAPRGHHPEEHGDRQRNRRRESEHGRVDADGVEPRKIRRGDREQLASANPGQRDAGKRAEAVSTNASASI